MTYVLLHDHKHPIMDQFNYHQKWINSTDESIQLTKWRQILAIIINLAINDCVRFLKATPLNLSENALNDFLEMSCEQGNFQLHAVPINIF